MFLLRDLRVQCTLLIKFKKDKYYGCNNTDYL
nr:MAG TPA: hypothetical protein [Caudoviricetes sp.]